MKEMVFFNQIYEIVRVWGGHVAKKVKRKGEEKGRREKKEGEKGRREIFHFFRQLIEFEKWKSRGKVKGVGAQRESKKREGGRKEKQGLKEGRKEGEKEKQFLFFECFRYLI